MTREIAWRPQSLRDMQRLSADERIRITAAIERLADTNYGDVKRLTGVEPPEWRLRVGDYRVRFRYDEELDERTRQPVEMLRILRVLHRREAYRD